MIFMMFVWQEAGASYWSSYQGKQLLNFCTACPHCVHGCYPVTRDMPLCILLHISIPCLSLGLATLLASLPALTVQ